MLNLTFPRSNSITKCLSHVTLGCSFLGHTLQKLNGLVLSPIVGFFSRLPTRIGSLVSIDILSYTVRSRLHSCVSLGAGA
jgi:hypothetical protein